MRSDLFLTFVLACPNDSRDGYCFTRDVDSAIKGALGLRMENIRIGHVRGGLIVEVETDCGPHGKEVKSAVVLRTARRLFEGNVLFYL